MKIIYIHIYLHCGFGHPCQGYEHFLLHVKARTQHTHIGKQDSYQQGNEQGSDTQTYTDKSDTSELDYIDFEMYYIKWKLCHLCMASIFS